MWRLPDCSLCCALSRSVVSDSHDPIDRSLPGSSVHGIFYVCVYAFIQEIYIEHLLYMLVNGHWPIRPAPELPGTHSSERDRLVNGINTWNDKFSDGIPGMLNLDWRISAQTPWRNLPQDLQICLDILNISVNLPSFIVHHFILNLLKFLTLPILPSVWVDNLFNNL